VNVSVGINDWISEEEDKRRWKNTYIEEGYQEGIAKGMKDGLEKGLKQGIEQGVEKGIEQGIEQSLKIVASNLFKQGMSKELIASVCNVSIEKIDTILEGKRE
ncbi:MAG: hypothetical protein K2G03_04605, partial [Bacilli bacterium]|nr:hypothetical protein [Bacilli bacterium]